MAVTGPVSFSETQRHKKGARESRNGGTRPGKLVFFAVLFVLFVCLLFFPVSTFPCTVYYRWFSKDEWLSMQEIIITTVQTSQNLLAHIFVPSQDKMFKLTAHNQSILQTSAVSKLMNYDERIILAFKSF